MDEWLITFHCLYGYTYHASLTFKAGLADDASTLTSLDINVKCTLRQRQKVWFVFLEQKYPPLFTFPEVFTPLTKQRNTSIQATARHTSNSQRIPSKCSIPDERSCTLKLQWYQWEWSNYVHYNCISPFHAYNSFILRWILLRINHYVSQSTYQPSFCQGVLKKNHKKLIWEYF